MERKLGASSGMSSRLLPDTRPDVEYRRNGESMLKIESGRELVQLGGRDLGRVGKEVMSFGGGKRRRIPREEVKSKGGNFLMCESDDALVMVHEQTFLQGCASREVEIKERELKSAWEALAKKEREVAESKREVVESENKLSIILNSLDERINLVEAREKKSELKEEEREKEFQRKMTDLSLKEEQIEKEFQRKTTELSLKQKEFLLVQGKMRELCNIAEEFADRVKMEDEKLVEKIMKQVENEREYVILVQKRMKNLELKEKLLNMKEEEFVRKVQQADKKSSLREESLRHDCMKRINMAESKIEAVKENADKKVREIESVCNVGWEITWDAYKDAESIRESIEKQFQDLEKMKRESESLQAKRRGDLASKEQQLEKMKHEFDSFQAKRMGELASKQQQLEKMTSEFESFQEKRRADLASKEQQLEKMKREFDSFQEKRRGDLASKEQQLEKMKHEFESFQEKRMGELESKEQHLYMMSEKLVEDARSRDEQLIKREKLGCQLVKRLESALDHVKGLKISVEGKLKTLGLEKADVQSIWERVDKKMNELDSEAVELQDAKKKMLQKEELLDSKEHQLHSRENDLKLKEQSLLSQQKDLERQQSDLEKASGELDVRKKNLKRVKEYMGNCFKEHVAAIENEVAAKKDLAEKFARDLQQEEEQLESMEYKEKQLMAHQEDKLKLVEWNHPHEANRNVESGDSVCVKFIVTMDGKTLQMYLNDPQKDLDSMGDEILTVLQLSSDPAKIVLDAMVGFYPPHLREGDTDAGVQRTCVVLLEQLVRMSPEISRHVREEAIELAHEWKSKMRRSAENPLELVGFLRLLAAYNLTSCFDPNEIMSFVTMVVPYISLPSCHLSSDEAGGRMMAG